MRDDLTSARRELASASRQLWIIDLRQAARGTCDLLHFGTGTTERLAAALVMAGGFFLLYLGVAVAVGLGVSYGLGFGGSALAVVAVTIAMLVLGPSDAVLEKRRDAVAISRAELRREVAQLEDEERERVARGDGRTPEFDYCPYCDERIRYAAVKCKHCGEYLDDDLRGDREPPTWNPGVAAVLSFLIPGLGQLYRGNVLAGFIWLVGVYGGYAACFIPGVVLHLVCIITAASGRR